MASKIFNNEFLLDKLNISIIKEAEAFEENPTERIERVESKLKKDKFDYIERNNTNLTNHSIHTNQEKVTIEEKRPSKNKVVFSNINNSSSNNKIITVDIANQTHNIIINNNLSNTNSNLKENINTISTINLVKRVEKEDKGKAFITDTATNTKGKHQQRSNSQDNLLIKY